jgi:5-methylcytosine-specific restriction endonuclease McrA
MPSPSDELREKMAAFKEAALYGRCAACGEFPHPLRTAAHHVVYRQHVPVEMAWDPRNSMPLHDDCHERHHNASRRIPLSALSEENLEFASEVLGEAAPYYLERRYD